MRKIFILFSFFFFLNLFVFPKISNAQTTEECQVQVGQEGHVGCTVCKITDNQKTCIVDEKRSSCTNGFKPDPQICNKMNLIQCADVATPVWGDMDGNCIQSDTSDPNTGYRKNEKQTGCIECNLSDAGCIYTTFQKCNESLDVSKKFKCVSDRCEECSSDESGCVINSECELTCNSTAEPYCDETNQKTKCLSGVCTDGKCEKGVTNISCTTYDQSFNGDGTVRSARFVCNTAIGPISADAQGFAQNLLKIVLGLAGGILLILIIINGYKIMTSQGDPEKLKDAREGIIAAIAGILLIIFSLSILQLITADIIGIPGFG